MNVTDPATLAAVYGAMGEGVVVFGPDGCLSDASPVAERLLGRSRERLLGSAASGPEWAFVREDGTPLPATQHPVLATLASGRAVRVAELGLRGAEGEWRWVSVATTPVSPEPGVGAPRGAVAVLGDRSSLRTLAASLVENRGDLTALLDNLPARISSFNADGRNRFANGAAERRMNFLPGAASGRTVREIMGPAWYAKYGVHVEEALAGRRQRFLAVDAAADGSPRYSQVEYVPALRDGASAGFYSLTVDVTEQQLARERIRDLVQRMATVREDERRRIALRLHEGIAQELFALKLALAHLEARSREGRLAEATAELAAAIDVCMEETRRIAVELRPFNAPQLLLSVAIREHARRFATLSGLAIEVRVASALPALDEASRSLFFSAAQEALTNVARHARARTAEVVLKAEAGALVMEVVDDGAGLDEAATAKPGSLGLLGIRECFEAVGGQLVVGARPGGGTLFRVALPIPGAG